MGKRIFKNMDYEILICTIILITIGLIALFSATQSANLIEFKRQIMWILISIPIMLIIIFIDYETIAKFSPIMYFIVISLLVAVLFTKPVNGATSWFSIGAVSLQPAEFAKIIVIITLAFYISKIQEKGKDEVSRFTKLLKIFAIVL